MKKGSTLALLPIIVVCSLFLINSCSRHDSYWDSEAFKKQKSLTVADAKNWLEKEYRDEIRLSKSATIARSVSSIRPISYAEGDIAKNEPNYNCP